MVVDSGIYLAFVTTLAGGPGQLISVGANYLRPFLVLRLTNSDHLAFALLNCGLVLLSDRTVVRSFDLDRRRLVALLFLDPMLAISLL
jgi:hypothetical protein